MHKFFLISTAGLLFLVGCSDIKKPNDANFTKAINQYLAKHGQACTSLGQMFPVDVPISDQNDQYGIGSQMATLEQAGLVHSSNIVAAAPGVLRPGPRRPIKRYELTDEGRKYFRLAPGIFGKTGSFCYGQKTVDSIVKWTEPMTVSTYSQSEVTYTYKLLNLAGWAERPDVQRVFSDIRGTVNGASKTDQIAGLQLTNKGWEVPVP